MNENTRIYLSAPDVGQEEERAVIRALRSGWVSPHGPEIDAFEGEIADFIGVQNAVALNSGTAALHLSLIAAGVRRGDSVITATMTFVATVNAISYVGARPVLVDTLEDGTIDPQFLRKAILIEREKGHRVGAIIPVDIYGRLSNYEEVLSLPEVVDIPVVADSAEALGSERAGRKAGAWGDVAALSFNGNKIMTTSGGGMLVTNDPEIAKFARFLASQAREPALHYEHAHLGFNYRLSNVSAAIGRAQLSRLPEMIARRRLHRARYKDFFSSVHGLRLLKGNIEEDNCWLTSVLIDRAVLGWGPIDLLHHLEQSNIESRPLWKPMHMQPLYSKEVFVGERVAETLFERGLVLPSGSSMSDSEFERVLEVISDFLESR